MPTSEATKQAHITVEAVTADDMASVGNWNKFAFSSLAIRLARWRPRRRWYRFGGADVQCTVLYCTVLCRVHALTEVLNSALPLTPRGGGLNATIEIWTPPDRTRTAF